MSKLKFCWFTLRNQRLYLMIFAIACVLSIYPEHITQWFGNKIGHIIDQLSSACVVTFIFYLFTTIVPNYKVFFYFDEKIEEILNEHIKELQYITGVNNVTEQMLSMLKDKNALNSYLINRAPSDKVDLGINDGGGFRYATVFEAMLVVRLNIINLVSGVLMLESRVPAELITILFKIMESAYFSVLNTIFKNMPHMQVGGNLDVFGGLFMKHHNVMEELLFFYQKTFNANKRFIKSRPCNFSKMISPDFQERPPIISIRY